MAAKKIDDGRRLKSARLEIQVLDALKAPMSTTVLSETAGVNPVTLRAILVRLRRAGVIASSGAKMRTIWEVRPCSS